jgi:hypothetical protein
MSEPSRDCWQLNSLRRRFEAVAQRAEASVVYAGFAHAADDYLRDQSGLKIAAARRAKDQIQVLVISGEQPSVLFLLGTKELKDRGMGTGSKGH